MAKKKKEEVVEQTTEQPKLDDKVEKLKVKKKPSMKKLVQDNEPIKVDLSKTPKTEENEQSVDATKTEDVQEKVVEETTGKEEVTEQPTEEDSETPVLEEVTDEEAEEKVEEKVEEITEQVQEAVAESQETGKPLPEDIQKLMDFMGETGGDLEDYVALKRDYNNYDDASLLMEHYTRTKPHLTEEEIRFTLEDQFSWDEDVDDEV